LAVGKLRTHKASAVSDLSKQIVKQWKAAVDKAKAGGGGSASSTPTISTSWISYLLSLELNLYLR